MSTDRTTEGAKTEAGKTRKTEEIGAATAETAPEGDGGAKNPQPQSERGKIIREALDYIDDHFLIADGFDDCVIGTCYTPGPGTRVVYSAELIVEKLIREGLSFEDAWDHIHFNIEGGYVGEKTPIFVLPLNID